MSDRGVPTALSGFPTPARMYAQRRGGPFRDGIPFRRVEMSMQQASMNARAAVNALHNVSVICRNLSPLDSPMDDEQLRQRARLIHSVLRARQQMEQLRNRAVQLASSLERFRLRRLQIQGLAPFVERRVNADPRFVQGFNDLRKPKP